MLEISHLESELDITFLDKPTHPLGLVLLGYWEGIKEPQEALPNTDKLDPIEIPKVLPFVSLVDVLDAGEKFVTRLMGTGAADLVHEDRTGKLATDIAANKGREQSEYLQNYWQTLCQASYQTAAPFHFRTTMNESERSYITLEVSMFPMKEQNGNINRLLIGAFKVADLEAVE